MSEHHDTNLTGGNDCPACERYEFKIDNLYRRLDLAIARVEAAEADRDKWRQRCIELAGEFPARCPACGTHRTKTCKPDCWLAAAIREGGAG